MTQIPPPVTKVFLDKVLSLLLLVLTSPLSALIVLAITIENMFIPDNRGGLVYTEIRISAGRPFTLYKYRILKRPAIEKIRREGAVPKTVENQPENLTKTGKWLKKIGVDELLQFVNILKGDMSFVGPRPKPTAEYDAFMDQGVTYRALVRAGLTGPAQVMKGTQRSSDEERAADIGYVELLRSGSAWAVLKFDLRVLRQTIKVIFKATGE